MMAIQYPIPQGLNETWTGAQNWLSGLLGNIFDPNKQTQPPAIPRVPTQPPPGLPDMMAGMIMQGGPKEAYESGMIGMGPMPLISRKMLEAEIIGNKKPWEMTLQEFMDAANRGRIRGATGKFNKAEKLLDERAAKGEYISPLQMGEAAGYSPEDIAKFYIQRRGGGYSGMVIGRQEYIRDAIDARRNIPEEVLGDYPKYRNLIKKINKGK